jgi:hypothetical protein
MDGRVDIHISSGQPLHDLLHLSFETLELAGGSVLPHTQSDPPVKANAA